LQVLIKIWELDPTLRVLLLLNHHILSNSDLLYLDPLDIGDNLDVELALSLLELSDFVFLK